MNYRQMKKVGLALSGGAARALSHIVVLEVPYSLGIGVKAIASSSMGDIIGSLISSGMSISEMKSYVV